MCHVSYLGLIRPLVSMRFDGIVKCPEVSVLEIGIEKGYSSFVSIYINFNCDNYRCIKWQ